MSMSQQRVSEVASVCLKMVRDMRPARINEIVYIVSRGYLKMVQESEEWKSSASICNIGSLDQLVRSLLGKDAGNILGKLSHEDQILFGFVSVYPDEEKCFVWAWRAFCLYGRQVHHSQVTPKELVA
jgi:hypothetical protein